jgi:phosphomannomutase
MVFSLLLKKYARIFSMSEPIKLAVSGYRGVWGETLTQELVRDFSRAFAKFTKKRGGGRILIGRDARPTGETIEPLVSAALSSEDIAVTIGGLLPTPSIMFLVREMGFDGAIIITASHNPSQYNGLKFVTGRGMMTNEEEANEIAQIMLELPEEASGHGEVNIVEGLSLKHATHILEKIDTETKEKIISARFKIVLDSINSVGILPAKLLLTSLGCEVTYLNDTPNGEFAHTPEPLPENLTKLAETVKKVGAHVGFAQDPDADRIVFCDEQGVIVFEEYTVALGVLSVLRKTKGDITVNLASSKVSEMIATSYGVKTHYAKVGEGNVVDTIIKEHCVVGGEGSGGIIYPAMNPCRDSITGMALILSLLAETKKPLSHVVAELPKTFMRKMKFPLVGTLDSLYQKIESAFPGGTKDTRDGLRLDFTDGSWLSLRASNTEPIARATIEALTEDRAQEMLDILKVLLS